MEVTVTLQKKDWEIFQSHVDSEVAKSINTWRDRTWTNLLLWGLIALFLFFAFGWLNEFHWRTAVMVSLFFILIFMYFSIKITNTFNAYTPSDNGTFIGEQHHIFNDKGIKTKGKGYEVFQEWTVIKKIERIEGMIFIYVDKVCALIFPENQLQDPDKFFCYVNEKWEANKT